jgi:hypothetical protein
LGGDCEASIPAFRRTATDVTRAGVWCMGNLARRWLCACSLAQPAKRDTHGGRMRTREALLCSSGKTPEEPPIKSGAAGPWVVDESCTISAERAPLRITEQVSGGWRRRAAANRQRPAGFVRPVCEGWAGQREGPASHAGEALPEGGPDQASQSGRFWVRGRPAGFIGGICAGAGVKDAGPPGTPTAPDGCEVRDSSGCDRRGRRS